MQVVESVPSQAARRILYSVKIISPVKKSEYTVQKMRTSSIFQTVEDLKQEMSTIKGIPSTIDQLGYIEPNRGVKGRQHWIITSEDLVDMYRSYVGKDEIVLWCTEPKPPSSSKAKKRSRSPEPETSGNMGNTGSTGKKSRYSSHSEKMIEVETISDQLRAKHDKVYSHDQINAWAHMIQMGKWDNYDSAPPKPFKTPSGPDATKKSIPISVSPGKSVQLKGQLVDQLLKWHELLEKGGITQEQYEELQESIMKDVKKFLTVQYMLMILVIIKLIITRQCDPIVAHLLRDLFKC